MNLYLKEIFSRDNQRSRRSWRWKQTESPIFEFVRYGNTPMVKYILHYELHPIENYTFVILLEAVNSCGHKDIGEIFEILLKNQLKIIFLIFGSKTVDTHWTNKNFDVRHA